MVACDVTRSPLTAAGLGAVPGTPPAQFAGTNYSQERGEIVAFGGRPRWQQMTALVSLSAGGAITGFSFVPKAAADISSPTSMPLNLVALQQSARSAHTARTAPASDAMLRKAIVNVADYYLRMAERKTPAEMEAIIWRHDSVNGADHGQSCAAFASLTLELAAQVVGQQSWVSGGSSYPWPLHSWADVRVDPNPASLGIISIQQDAEAQHRWHPLGDGYRPLPGDWVLFDGHVEVVTEDSGGVLRTVGGDSLPNFSVNAHEYRAPLSGAGVVGFVNNGSLPAAAEGAQQDAAASGDQATSPGGSGTGADAAGASAGGLAAIPGTGAVAPQNAGPGEASSRQSGARGTANRAAARREPGSDETGGSKARSPMSAPQAPGDAVIPGLAVPAPRSGPATEKEASGKAATGETATGQAAGGKAAAGKAAGQRPARPAAAAAQGDAAIPGLDVAADLASGHHDVAYRRHHPSPARRPVSETRAQQAFISEVAPGAIAAQHRYGVPAAVTIAQAIDESGWGQSELAAQDHNLFGIKGTGPAGSVPMPTQEYVNGQPVNTSASFRVYHDAAESIDDHGRLLARSGYYQQAMAEHQHPDKFAAALTGVYATDPNYGANLISLMRRYDLYRYSASDANRPGRSPAGRSRAAWPPGSRATRLFPECLAPLSLRPSPAGPPARRPRPRCPRGRPVPSRPGQRPRSRPGQRPRSRPGQRPRSRPGPRPRSPSRRRARTRPGPMSRYRPGPRARTPPGPMSRYRPGPRARTAPGPASRSRPEQRARHRRGRLLLRRARPAARSRPGPVLLSGGRPAAQSPGVPPPPNRRPVPAPRPPGPPNPGRPRTAAPPGRPPRLQRVHAPRPHRPSRPPRRTSPASPRRLRPHARRRPRSASGRRLASCP